MHSRLARDLFVSSALIVLVLLAYFGAWDKKFVYFDDPGYVTDNLNVQKGLPLFNNPYKMLHEGKIFNDPATFRDSVYWSFTAFEQSNWHPLILDFCTSLIFNSMVWRIPAATT